MNNNYHTQMDKQNNMLNEIAANNNLLQQQLQNFTGTPINKESSTQPQQITTQQQLTPQQLMYAQMIQQNQQTAQLYQPPQQNYQAQGAKQADSTDDEIELSDTKPEPPTIDNNVQLNIPENKKNQQVNKQLQQILKDTGKNSGAATTNNKPRPTAVPKRMPPPPVRYVHVGKAENKITEYVIVPILLVAAFVGIMHPKTSSILGKYFPGTDSIKGLLIRGVLLAIIYIVIRMVLNMM